MVKRLNVKSENEALTFIYNGLFCIKNPKKEETILVCKFVIVCFYTEYRGLGFSLKVKLQGLTRKSLKHMMLSCLFACKRSNTFKIINATSFNTEHTSSKVKTFWARRLIRRVNLGFNLL